jgi:energy-coupling factor transport system ATP-binding protein
VLDIQQVSFAYPGHAPALKEVSLTVAAGDFIGLAGRNGSGKTTLTRIMVGLAKPVSGQVLLDGQNTIQCGPATMARAIGYVFQNPDRQIFRDTVAQEVAFGPEQMDWSDSERAQSVADALKMTGLESVAAAYPRGLTRSFRQRVAIASALALKPRLLILDEPTSGQDAEEKAQLMSLLDELNQQGIGVILVTHDMELLLAHSRRAVVLHQGEKVFDGPTEELFAAAAAVQVAEWGLRVPDAAVVAGKLEKSLGAVRTVEELADRIEGQLRGDEREKSGAPV